MPKNVKKNLTCEASATFTLQGFGAPYVLRTAFRKHFKKLKCYVILKRSENATYDSLCKNKTHFNESFSPSKRLRNAVCNTLNAPKPFNVKATFSNSHRFHEKFGRSNKQIAYLT